MFFTYNDEVPDNKGITLIDGDRISALYAATISQLMDKLKGLGFDFKIGVVHTAYANSAAINFIKDSGFEVKCCPTGVKHSHHAALSYDIGKLFVV